MGRIDRKRTLLKNIGMLPPHSPMLILLHVIYRWTIIKCQRNVTCSTRIVVEQKIIIAKPLSELSQIKPFFCERKLVICHFGKSLNYCLPSTSLCIAFWGFMLLSACENHHHKFVVMTIKTEGTQFSRRFSAAVVNFNSFHSLSASLSGHFGFIYCCMSFSANACVPGMGWWFPSGG